MSLIYLQELSAALEKQLFWLEYSYKQVQDHSSPDKLSIEQFNQFENQGTLIDVLSTTPELISIGRNTLEYSQQYIQSRDS